MWVLVSLPRDTSVSAGRFPEGSSENGASDVEDVRPGWPPPSHRHCAGNTEQRNRPGTDAAQANKRCKHAQTDRTAARSQDLLSFLHLQIPRKCTVQGAAVGNT